MLETLQALIHIVNCQLLKKICTSNEPHKFNIKGYSVLHKVCVWLKQKDEVNLTEEGEKVQGLSSQQS